MSNQGTDCFLELLIAAAESLMQTKTQKELVSFLKQQKNINEIAPGTAGFDIGNMPWDTNSLTEDVLFMLRVTDKAQHHNTWNQLGYEPQAHIVIPWLEQFAEMLKKIALYSI
ncbi:MAG: hypothetical protein Q4F00_10060 [bacterium]|nr:hypothetical protein [bacterium]